MTHSLNAAEELRRIIVKAREQYARHYDNHTREALRAIFGASTFEETKQAPTSPHTMTPQQQHAVYQRVVACLQGCDNDAVISIVTTLAARTGHVLAMAGLPLADFCDILTDNIINAQFSDEAKEGGEQ